MIKKNIFLILSAVIILLSAIFSAAFILRPKEIILPVSLTTEEKQKTENSIAEILKQAKNRSSEVRLPQDSGSRTSDCSSKKLKS